MFLIGISNNDKVLSFLFLGGFHWQEREVASIGTSLDYGAVWGSRLLLSLVTRPSPIGHRKCLTNKDNCNLALLHLHSLHKYKTQQNSDLNCVHKRQTLNYIQVRGNIYTQTQSYVKSKLNCKYIRNHIKTNSTSKSYNNKRCKQVTF